MNFELISLTWPLAAEKAAAALLVLVPATVPEDDDTLTQLVAQARAAGALESKPGQTLVTWRPAGLAAERVVLASSGEGTAAQVRQAVQAALPALKKAEQLLLVLPTGTSAAAVQAAVQALAQASYVYTSTLSKPEPRTLQTVTLAVPEVTPELQNALAVASATVAGVELAKEWANRPANHATPKLLADAAKALVKSAKTSKLHCEVLGPKEVAELGMGAFLAVAQGSTEPLRWIELRYSGASKTHAPVVLIGKGITFDTGGISLKPGAEMDEMKYDMCGAASVLGVFKALAELKPKINVVGLIPACENMPAGNAVKPGDVVKSLSGQTIEILNTDAEGRLILCDALSYAASFKPAAVIDIATLTGACVIALGGVRHGLFSNDDTLAAALQQAGEDSQDPCWRMPLDDDYAEGLKTKYADVANVAGRAAGSVTAAKFLQRFAPEGCPWAHLDIAGTAWKSGAAKGATGRPVALLLNYLLHAA